MDRPHLIYVADPMCSWCWGFSPVIEAIRQRFGPGLPIRLVLGGLRPGTTEPLSGAAKAEIREHWEHVHAATGQPFDWSFFDRRDFVYDTEPASRAVVVMRRRGMAAGLDGLRRVHAAFYAENRDVTEEEVLADLAEELGEERAAFLAALREEGARVETGRDFAVAQASGIRGFPCLLAGMGADEDYGLVTSGYRPAEQILPVLERWLAALRAEAPAADG